MRKKKKGVWEESHVSYVLRVRGGDDGIENNSRMSRNFTFGTGWKSKVLPHPVDGRVNEGGGVT